VDLAGPSVCDSESLEAGALAWISVSRLVRSKRADLNRFVRMLPIAMKGNVNVRLR
jgi:hypothetical protein